MLGARASFIRGQCGSAVGGRLRTGDPCMAARYVLTSSTGSQFDFILKGNNGETILVSERYTSKQSALNGIQSVRNNSTMDARYVRGIDRSGAPRFNLLGGNGEIIGTSESYSSAQARDVGIASCKANGPTATLDDRT